MANTQRIRITGTISVDLTIEIEGTLFARVTDDGAKRITDTGTARAVESIDV